MSKFLSRRGVLSGMFGAFAAMLTGVPFLRVRGQSADAAGGPRPSGSRALRYVREPIAEPTVTTTVYDAQGRATMWIDGAGGNGEAGRCAIEIKYEPEM